MSSPELENIPPSWQWSTLSEIAAIKGGLTKGKKRKETDKLLTVPYLRVANVQRGFLDLEEIRYIQATEDELNQLKLISGDILFTEGGDRDKLGRGWIWVEEIEECIHQNHVFRARLYLQKLPPKLISFYSNSFGQKYFLGAGKQTTNLASINLTKLSNLPIPLPPLNEQHRIVAKIEALTDRSRNARAALDAIPAMLEQFRQSVLAAAFRGDLTADWRSQNPDVEPVETLLERIRTERRARWEAAELEKMKAKGKVPKNDKWKEKYGEHSVFIDPHLAWIPETWTFITLDELAKDTSNALAIGPFGSNLKVVDYCDKGVPLVFVREIRAEKFGGIETKFVSPNKADELKSHSVLSGDLLVTKMGDPPGDTSVYPANRPLGIITADCIKLSPEPELSSSTFLKYWLRTRFIKNRILEETKGVAQQKLSLKRFRKIIIPLPPLKEQEIILTSLERYFQLSKSVLKETTQLNQEITQLDQSILAKAFRGQLVPKTPTTNPPVCCLSVFGRSGRKPRKRKGKEDRGQGAGGK